MRRATSADGSRAVRRSACENMHTALALPADSGGGSSQSNKRGAHQSQQAHSSPKVKALSSTSVKVLQEFNGQNTNASLRRSASSQQTKSVGSAKGNQSARSPRPKKSACVSISATATSSHYGSPPVAARTSAGNAYPSGMNGCRSSPRAHSPSHKSVNSPQKCSPLQRSAQLKTRPATVTLSESSNHKAESADCRDGEETGSSTLQSAAHWLAQISAAENEERHEVVVRLFELAIECGAQPAEKIFDALQACRERYSQKREAKASNLRLSRKTGKTNGVESRRVRGGNERLSASRQSEGTSSAAVAEIVGPDRKCSGRETASSLMQAQGGHDDASDMDARYRKKQQQDRLLGCASSCDSIGNSMRIHDRDTGRNGGPAALGAEVATGKGAYGERDARIGRKAGGKSVRENDRDDSVRVSLTELRQSIHSVFGTSKKEGNQRKEDKEDTEIGPEEEMCRRESSLSSSRSSSSSSSSSDQETSSEGTECGMTRQSRECRNTGQDEDNTSHSADSMSGVSSDNSSSNANDAAPSPSIRSVDLRSGTDDESSLADIRAAMKSGPGLIVVVDEKRNGKLSITAKEFPARQGSAAVTISAGKPSLKADISTHVSCTRGATRTNVGLSAKVAASRDSQSKKGENGDVKGAMAPVRLVSLRSELSEDHPPPSSDLQAEKRSRQEEGAIEAGDKIMPDAAKKNEEESSLGQSSMSRSVISLSRQTRRLPELPSEQIDSSVARQHQSVVNSHGEGDVEPKAEASAAAAEAKTAVREELARDAKLAASIEATTATAATDAAAATATSPSIAATGTIAGVEQSEVSLASKQGSAETPALPGPPAGDVLLPMAALPAALVSSAAPTYCSMKEKMSSGRRLGHARSLSLIGGVLDQVSTIRFPSPVHEAESDDLQPQRAAASLSSCDSDRGSARGSRGLVNGISATLPSILHHRHHHTRSWSSVGAQKTASSGVASAGSPWMPRAMSSVGLLRTSNGENIVAIPPEAIAMRSPPRGKWAALGANLLSSSRDWQTDASRPDSGTQGSGGSNFQGAEVQDEDVLRVMQDPQGAARREADGVSHQRMDDVEDLSSALEGSNDAAVHWEESAVAVNETIRPSPEPTNRSVGGYSSMTDILRSEKQRQRHFCGGMSSATDSSRANTARNQKGTSVLDRVRDVDRKDDREFDSSASFSEGAESRQAIEKKYSMPVASSISMRRRHARSQSMLEESADIQYSRIFPSMQKAIAGDQSNGDPCSNSWVNEEEAPTGHRRSQSTLEGPTGMLSIKKHLPPKKVYRVDDVTSGTSDSSIPWAYQERDGPTEDAASFSCKKSSSDIPVTRAYESAAPRRDNNDFQRCTSSSRSTTTQSGAVFRLKPYTSSTSFDSVRGALEGDIGDEGNLGQSGIEEEGEGDCEVGRSGCLVADGDEQYQLAVAITSCGSKCPYFPKGVTIDEDEELQDMDSSGRTLLLSPPPSSAAARAALNADNSGAKSVRSSRVRNLRTNIYALRGMRTRSEEGAGVAATGVAPQPRRYRFVQEERTSEVNAEQRERGEAGRTSGGEEDDTRLSSSVVDMGFSGDTGEGKRAGLTDSVIECFNRQATSSQPPSPSIRFRAICDEVDEPSDSVQNDDMGEVVPLEIGGGAASAPKEQLTCPREEAITPQDSFEGDFRDAVDSRVGAAAVSEESVAEVPEALGEGDDKDGSRIQAASTSKPGAVSKASCLFRPRCEGKNLPPREQIEQVGAERYCLRGNGASRTMQSLNQNVGVNRKGLVAAQDVKVFEPSACSVRSGSASSRLGRAESGSSSGSSSVTSDGHQMAVEPSRDRMRSGGGRSFDSLHALTPVREEEEEAMGIAERTPSEEMNRKNLEWAAALSLARSHSLGSQLRLGVGTSSCGNGGGRSGCALGGALNLFPAAIVDGGGCASPPIQFSQEIGGLVLPRSAPLAQGQRDADDETGNLSDDNSGRRGGRKDRRRRREGNDCRITRSRQGGTSKLARLFCFF
ncbi:hypothetical protein CBR_g58827 [Chara braunii]|uniref:Uncharacterized protein n=1 Tax=Chara braunii TaxID=69332 RepID=A0A388K8E8_CHABU|nr:hypothetical protein CBR_g58827 [Chara braunii]|eukprot:GBG66337.1 hypothetical protein CBR_g58827 [Chara braunii]